MDNFVDNRVDTKGQWEVRTVQERLPGPTALVPLGFYFGPQLWLSWLRPRLQVLCAIVAKML